MRRLNYIELFFSSIMYSILPEKQQERIQLTRLQHLVHFARSKSRFFNQLYSRVSDDCQLSDLPITTKQMMMQHFDSWVTDPDAHLDRVKAFMSDQENLSKQFLNRYMAATTSGSTGYPAILLYDHSTRNVATVISCTRTRILRFPMCCIFVDEDFGMSNGIVRQNLKKFPFLKKFMRVVNAKRPIEEVDQELNEARPKVITGYPGTLEILADEAIEGRLSIRPSLIVVSGEHLSEKTREKIKSAFHCTVQSLYGCTEGGSMACECRFGHLHINSDWCILEPVDADFKPVRYGELSNKLLLTNLANRIQPIIRYELTDRAIIHDDPCPCGRSGLWIEIEGRTSDVLYFDADGKKIGIAPMSLYDTIEVVPGVKHFQVILHENNTIELRLVCMPSADVQQTFDTVDQEIRKSLMQNHVQNARVYLSDLLPQLDPRSGKFKQIYQAFNKSVKSQSEQSQVS